MSKCDGQKDECKDADNHDWCGEGTFACSHWNNEKGECDLGEKL
jgi:hypothetical protein